MRRREANLRRRRHTREPKKRFVVFCEGGNTEPSYFVELQRAYPNALVVLELNPAAGVPHTIAGKALARAKSLGLTGRRRPQDSFEERDEVWALFDRDEHHRYEEAINTCKQNGINVGCSNPCFEVWLILHLKDYDKPQDRSAVQTYLARIHPQYDPKGKKIAHCADLIRNVEQAEVRAADQLTRREAEAAKGRPLEAPYTTVDKLTRAIRAASRSAN